MADDLERLLESAFSNAELGLFLRDLGGERVERLLPSEQIPKAEYVGAAVAVLRKRRLVGHRLFDHLVAALPRRTADIEVVRRTVLSGSAAGPVPLYVLCDRTDAWSKLGDAVAEGRARIVFPGRTIDAHAVLERRILLLFDELGVEAAPVYVTWPDGAAPGNLEAWKERLWHALADGAPVPASERLDDAIRERIVARSDGERLLIVHGATALPPGLEDVWRDYHRWVTELVPDAPPLVVAGVCWGESRWDALFAKVFKRREPPVAIQRTLRRPPSPRPSGPCPRRTSRRS
jgi:hypothetical protein